MKKDKIANSIKDDIVFVTEKMDIFREDYPGRLDVKQQADIQRYAQTRLSLVKTLAELEKVAEK